MTTTPNEHHRQQARRYLSTLDDDLTALSAAGGSMDFAARVARLSVDGDDPPDLVLHNLQNALNATRAAERAIRDIRRDLQRAAHNIIQAKLYVDLTPAESQPAGEDPREAMEWGTPYAPAGDPHPTCSHCDRPAVAIVRTPHAGTTKGVLLAKCTHHVGEPAAEPEDDLDGVELGRAAARAWNDEAQS